MRKNDVEKCNRNLKFEKIIRFTTTKQMNFCEIFLNFEGLRIDSQQHLEVLIGKIRYYNYQSVCRVCWNY